MPPSSTSASHRARSRSPAAPGTAARAARWAGWRRSAWRSRRARAVARRSGRARARKRSSIVMSSHSELWRTSSARPSRRIRVACSHVRARVGVDLLARQHGPRRRAARRGPRPAPCSRPTISTATWPASWNSRSFCRTTVCPRCRSGLVGSMPSLTRSGRPSVSRRSSCPVGQAVDGVAGQESWPGTFVANGRVDRSCGHSRPPFFRRASAKDAIPKAAPAADPQRSVRARGHLGRLRDDDGRRLRPAGDRRARRLHAAVVHPRPRRQRTRRPDRQREPAARRAPTRSRR